MNLSAALKLHKRVHPARWCVTRSEFDQFVEEVSILWSSHQIPCSAPNPLHLDPRHGPNLYDVNSYVVKPRTLAAGGASYALIKHPDGLQCEVFVSHCWHGGLFHLQRSIRIAWPQLYSLRNLYCCLLANPQNLDLDHFLGGPIMQSPFALALQEATHLLVVPNPSIGVYSRLWCVFEAFLGAKWNKIYLLPAMPDRKQTFKRWFYRVGLPMLCSLVLVGIPLFLVSYCLSLRQANTGIFSWVELVYSLLSSLALCVVLAWRHSSWALPMMTCLTCVGCAYIVIDVDWSYADCMAEGWIGALAGFARYGWCANLTVVNALVTFYLVVLEAEILSFEEQKDMMRFTSLWDSHCSKAEDEERIRHEIAGFEEEVEAAICILLAAGAYTENLQRCWDHGLNIERAGMRDTTSGLLFSLVIWCLVVMDLVSDAFLATSYQACFTTLLILYSLTTCLIPATIRCVEQQGPDCAVFAARTWGLAGMLALNLPRLLGFFEGIDIPPLADLSQYFNRSYMASADTATWKDSSYLRVTPVTGWLVRLLCLIGSWGMIFIGLPRWNRLRIDLLGTWRPLDSDGESDISAEL